MKTLLEEDKTYQIENKKISIYILVFKTNIRYKKDLKLMDLLFCNITWILSWSVDLSDKDKVLRVEAFSENPLPIINVINQAGFYCEELPD